MKIEIEDAMYEKVKLASEINNVEPQAYVMDSLISRLIEYFGEDLDELPKAGIYTCYNHYDEQVAKDKGEDYIPEKIPCYILKNVVIMGEKKVKIVCRGEILNVNPRLVKEIVSDDSTSVG